MAAYEILLLNTAIPQIQAAQSGDTYVCPRDIAFSAALTLSAGTANGVPYLNGSKVLTTGSALTYNGNTLGLYSATAGLSLQTSVNTNQAIITLADADGRTAVFRSPNSGSPNLAQIGTTTNHDLAFLYGNSEQMRLTSTGLGIGTATTTNGRLNVQAGTAATGNSAFFSNPDGTYNPYLQIQHSSAGVKLFNGSSFGAASNNLIFGNGGTAETMRIDGSGNLGLGVTPSAWTTYNVLQVGKAALTHNNNNTYLGANWFYDGANKYIATDHALLYAMENGQHIWLTAPSGTAGNAITFTQAMTLDASGNLKLGGTADRATTAGTNHLDIFNGTAPVGTLTDGISIYSSSGEAYVMDAAGNATLFSPHDAETNEWIFKSKHTPTGKVLKIDVERLLKFVNDHFGLDAVHEFVEK